jgi:amidase
MDDADCGAFVPGGRRLIETGAAGPLRDVTFAVKDLIDVEGMVTGGGNPDWAADRTPATKNAIAVERLLSAGARFVGKTVTDELAFSLEGENAHYGTPVNPHAPERMPGGSSSGSAVAVAAGLADVALGTDTGGSVRVPAAFCGIYGFRPTHGRIPLDGVIPFSPGYDTVGWLARSGEMLARAGEALLTGKRGEMPTRFLIAEDIFEMIDPECAAPLRETAARWKPSPVSAFDGAFEPWHASYRALQGREVWNNLGPWIAARRPRFGDAIAPRFADAASISDKEVTIASAFRIAQTARLRDLLPPGTALIVPTAPSLPLLKTAGGDERGAFYGKALAINAVAGHAGLPQLAMPAGALGGLPLSLSFIAARYEDERLLALAAA